MFVGAQQKGIYCIIRQQSECENVSHESSPKKSHKWNNKSSSSSFSSFQTANRIAANASVCFKASDLILRE